MSIGIMPYLTDLAAIRRLQTSGACVIEEIVARQRDRIDHTKPGVEQAMRAIVRGHRYEDGTGGSTFGYAVEQSATTTARCRSTPRCARSGSMRSRNLTQCCARPV
jgi:hypothetical protein